MGVKPEKPLSLDIKIIRQKQVVRILTSSSLDVTGENYSRSDLAFNAYTWIYYSPID